MNCYNAGGFEKMNQNNIAKSSSLRVHGKSTGKGFLSNVHVLWPMLEILSAILEKKHSQIGELKEG